MAKAPREPDEDDDEIDAVPFWKRGRVQIAAAVAAIALAWIFTHGKPPPKPDETKNGQDAFVGVVVPYQPWKAASEPPPVVVAKTSPPPAQPAPAAPPPPPPPAPVAPVPMPPRMPPVGMAPVIVTKPSRPVMSSYVVKIDPPKAAAAPVVPDQTTVDFKTAKIPGAKASAAMDTTLMLMPGILPLVLDTAIQSDLPGPLLAHTPGPVYSTRGVLLLPAGTQVIGKYDTLGKSGSNRLMAVSTYAVTPEGVLVPLTGEPLADDLGRSGLDGEVNNHHLQRFGAAIALTLGESAMNILQASASKGGNSYLQIGGGGGGSGVSGVAQQILQAQINIPATFSKHQGETIGLFIDQPIDFSSSYKVRSAQ